MAQTNPPFMSGVPELLVLRILAGREMYGYELVKAVRLVTGEAIGLGEGVVYPYAGQEPPRTRPGCRGRSTPC